MILGIDEVGRGPWAGPLVIGAVVLPESFTLAGLTDSKKISAKKRGELDVLIRQQALGWGLGWVHAQELDEVGLSAALRLATIRAVEAVNVPYHEIIIDGTINFLSDTSKGQYVTTMPKADFLVPAVSAASIIAKVARDSFMEEQAVIYPEYGFERHVGYGTAKHTAALADYGVTPLHRRSFAPIKKLLLNIDSPQSESLPASSLQTSKSIGSAAEHAVVDWLIKQKFTIVAQNWKTKLCEIDIIADSSDTRYFIEVKYRASVKQGGGIAAITPKKLQQMRFAAELHLARNSTEKAVKLAVIDYKRDAPVRLLEVE